MLFNNQRKCDKCHKNYATVHYKQNVNGKQSEAYLCSDCAAESGWGVHNSDLFSWDPFEGFDKLLGGFFLPQKVSGAAACPTCGRTLSDVKRSGRFGCSDCYTTFGDMVDLSPFTAGTYKGRRPLGSGAAAKEAVRETKEEKKAAKDELSELKNRLKEAVKKEECEEAATPRDRIRAMENGEAK